MSAGTKTVTVQHASFWYIKDGRHTVALRGDEIEVSAEDFERGDKHDAFAAKGEAVEPVAAALVPTEPVSDFDVTGTADEVLERVGDDPAKAQAALDAENASDKPRKTLVEKLSTIAGQS